MSAKDEEKSEPLRPSPSSLPTTTILLSSMKRIRRLFRRHRHAKLFNFHKLPLELLERILSFSSTSTLAAVSLSSFALLQLASPLLYREIRIPLDRLHELFCSRPSTSVSPRILPFLALEQIDALEIQDLPKFMGYRQNQPLEVPDRLSDPLSPLPLRSLLLTHRPFPGLVYRPSRGSVTFPLLAPSYLLLQQNLSHRTLGYPREIALEDPVALPLDRLKEVVFVNCVPDVTVIPEWYQCDRSLLRELGSVEGLAVVVDLTELEAVDREKTEEVLRRASLCEIRRVHPKRLGDRVEVWMRDEEEKTVMEKLARSLGWGERLDNGMLSVKCAKEKRSWRLSFD